MIFTNKTIIILIAVIIMLFSLVGITYAHGHGHDISIKPLEGGVIQVISNGSFSNEAEITIYNELENKVVEGSVDQEGKFDYSNIPEAASIVATDSMGNHTEWQIGAEVSERDVNPIIVLLVVLVLFLIAAVFYYKNQEKSKQ